jgi:hypothetical protein
MARDIRARSPKSEPYCRLRAVGAPNRKSRPANWLNIIILVFVLAGCTHADRPETSLEASVSPASVPSPLAPPTNGGDGGKGSEQHQRVCRPWEYQYALDKNGAQGALILEAGVRHASGGACRISDHVVLRLMDGAGHLLDVLGNPVHAILAGSVSTGGDEQTNPVVYAWRNWCDNRVNSFMFTVASYAHKARFRWTIGTPSCINSQAPSTLRIFTDRG